MEWISIKNHSIANTGYVGWIGSYEGDRSPDKVKRVESQIVEELLSLGAILYCKVIPTSRSVS